MKSKPGYPYRFEVKDKAFKKLIQSVLEKIPAQPEEFPQFAIIQKRFPSYEQRWGHVDDAELVQLDPVGMNRHRLSVDAKIGCIAHEFAHLFLEHVDADYDEAELEEIEKEADDKAIEWGFGKEICAKEKFRFAKVKEHRRSKSVAKSKKIVIQQKPK